MLSTSNEKKIETQPLNRFEISCIMNAYDSVVQHTNTLSVFVFGLYFALFFRRSTYVCAKLSMR